MWRIIRDLRPQYAIIENVGAVTFRGLDRVLGSLAEIGYDAEWQDIRASDVGAPHRRERIWIVAYPSKQGLQEREKDKKQKPILYAKRRGIEIPDTTKQGLEREISKRKLREWHKGLFAKCPGWFLEPDVGRLAHGVPHRVDRLKALGNSIVPQIAELLFRQIGER